ncbi:cilia- and flagella-associated protein 53-like [Synchiropus splendidus]|uniref:cilia- and flagella-associated protein 53-like n=1 Tax=Synchiropus splendidus TaxID=270530 RepID=UPI00237DA3F3|nr:cilia- and flagella-associated protein 53-like [Synchiropus splendidus]
MFLRKSRPRTGPKQAQEVTRDQLLDFSRTQRSCFVKNQWLQSSDRQVVRKQAERLASSALQEQQSDMEERRKRLWRLLQDEEVQLLQDMEGKSNKETPEERQAKMAERAKALREKRETERKQLVDNKLDQLFREKCQELRNNQSRQLAQHVSADRAGQLRSRKEQLERLRQEDDMFNRLWAADGRAKEERERQRVQKEQERGEELMKELKMQMEASEKQRRRDRELKEEEAHLLRQQQEVLQLQMQREQHQKLQLQEGRRQQLDESLREKMQRVAREEQDELQMDLQVLQQLQSGHNDRAAAAVRKERLRAEQLAFLGYVQEQRRQQEQQDQETQRLQEQQLWDVQLRQEQQKQLKQNAGRQLTRDVMDSFHLQVAHKRGERTLLRETEQTRRLMEELKLTEEENPPHSALPVTSH